MEEGLLHEPKSLDSFTVAGALKLGGNPSSTIILLEY
jgi:hypothetical protein